MASEKKDKQGDGLPEVDILLRGMLSHPGVEGFMIYNDAGELVDIVMILVES